MKRLNALISTTMATTAALAIAAPMAVAGDDKTKTTKMQTASNDAKDIDANDITADARKRQMRSNSMSNAGMGAYSSSKAFRTADANNDGALSRSEFMAYHQNTVIADDVRDYAYTQNEDMDRELGNWYEKADADKNDALSRREFAQAANQSKTTMTAPDYYTVTYYTTITRIDTDELEGRDVANLDGDDIGSISDIVRIKDSGEYFAMIDLDGRSVYQPGDMGNPIVGVKLSDILFYEDRDSLVLTTKGESELRNADAREIEEDDLEDVDSFYVSGR